MAELVANCPRCGTRRITFDVTALLLVDMQHGWQHWYEAFAVCRHCSRSTILLSAKNPTTIHSCLQITRRSKFKMR
jgi:hypothetical protein